MGFRYKPGVNVVEMLKDAGYTTYRLRKEKMLGESTIQKTRDGVLLSWYELDKICKLLNCRPSDIIEYDINDFKN